jgi:FMN phosphatase YigB (HAD superfamily)
MHIMFYQGIILDLDDTLYDYSLCHTVSLNAVIKFLQITDIDFNHKYKIISTHLKYELTNTASSHNKSIYFKHLLEQTNIGLHLFDNINDIYWTTFYDNMFCFDGVKEFIRWNKQQGIKIGILTDYETEFQIIKLNKLGLLQYVDVIVTSEEVGKEKPSVQMFQTIIRKLSMLPENVIMIGDNFDKDITGANNFNIFSYWFSNSESISSDKFNIFNSFVSLLIDFKLILQEIINLKQISKYCGERFDLVQSGGGNTSVKINNWMLIKASGCNLAQITRSFGYSIVNNAKLMHDILQNNPKDVMYYNVLGGVRGSIETYMHSILKKYTVHLHPIQSNRILISKNAREIIKSIYPNSLIIGYLTPGIKICNAINDIYNGENVIFLLNHGIIITTDSFDDIFNILNDVIVRFEIFQHINLDKYKYTNTLSNIINTTFNVDNITYLCQDSVINNYLMNKPELFNENLTFPDALVYCGMRILMNVEHIHEYNDEYKESPKIIIANNHVYINGSSISKCKEVEDVLKSNLLILDSEYDKNYLEKDELHFLNSWDAEKYRK